MAIQNIKEQVKTVFSEYIQEHGQRKTPERFAILDAVYSTQGHFESESIYRTLRTQNFQVSMATVYNTLEVLCDAGLVFKYQFGNSATIYERAYNREAHYHQICTQCGHVSDFESEALDEALQNINLASFKATSYHVHGYGICANCMSEDTTHTTE